MNSLPASSNAQTRFPDLLENALSTACEHLLAEPSIPGGMAQCIEIVVLDHALCKCHFYEMHSHCASCSEQIVYSGDGPVEYGGRNVAVLPDDALRCANCDLELHTACASPDGLCIICWTEQFPDEAAYFLRDAADVVPLEHVAFAMPARDVWDASNALSNFMSEHIASCSDVGELTQTDRDLDALGELIATRKREIAARTMALTNLRLSAAA